jgi:hypothetical protein
VCLRACAHTRTRECVCVIRRRGSGELHSAARDKRSSRFRSVKRRRAALQAVCCCTGATSAGVGECGSAVE